MLNTSLESSFGTHQDTVEPQVDFVVFFEPGSIAVDTVAGEEYHHVVSQGDQDEENQGGNHRPLIGVKNNRMLDIMVVSSNSCADFVLLHPWSPMYFIHTCPKTREY